MAYVPLLYLVFPTELSVHYIDIGQRHATLITYQKWTILIDSGDRYCKQKEMMEAYLAGLNITIINLAMATLPNGNWVS